MVEPSARVEPLDLMKHYGKALVEPLALVEAVTPWWIRWPPGGTCGPGVEPLALVEHLAPWWNLGFWWEILTVEGTFPPLWNFGLLWNLHY